MVLGSLMIGLIGGAGAAMAMILSGWGIWLALLAYSGVGILCLLLAALLGAALRHPSESHAVATPA